MKAELARMFIDRIVVHEAKMVDNLRRKGHKIRRQEIHIFLNCIGVTSNNGGDCGSLRRLFLDSSLSLIHICTE